MPAMPHYLQAAFWETRFNISEDDLEFLESHLRQYQRPLKVGEISELFVSKLIKKEEAKESQIRFYTPQDAFKVGDRLMFLRQGLVVRGTVTAVRDGRSHPALGRYSQKIEVEFDSTRNAVGKTCKFIGGCPSFPLNLREELSKGEVDWSKEDQRGFISPSEIAYRFRSIIEPKIKSAIENDGRFVYYDLQCYLFKALAQMNPDRMNAAYSAIIGRECPIKSQDLAELVFSLATDALGFQSAHFSMNYSLAKDSRFRNVGRPGYPEWTSSRSSPKIPQPPAVPPKAMTFVEVKREDVRLVKGNHSFKLRVETVCVPKEGKRAQEGNHHFTVTSPPTTRPPVPPHEARITVTHEMLTRGAIPVTPGIQEMIDFYGLNAQVVLLAYGGYEIKTELDLARNELVGPEILDWFKENSIQIDTLVFVRSPHPGKKKLRIFTYWESDKRYPLAHPVRSNLYLRHQAYSILQVESRFMHYKIIAQEISKSTNESVLPSSLDTVLAHNDHLFKRHARGIWGLQEWSPAGVSLDSQSLIMAIAEDDLVYRELDKGARPMTTREICQAIADYYSISVSQVSEIMPIDPQDPRIEQLDWGYWALRRTITTPIDPGQLRSGLLLKHFLGKRFPRLSSVEPDLSDSKSIRQSAQNILAALGWPAP